MCPICTCLGRKIEVAGGGHEFSLNLIWKLRVLGISHSVAPFPQFPNMRPGICQHHDGKIGEEAMWNQDWELAKKEAKIWQLLTWLLLSQKEASIHHPYPRPAPSGSYVQMLNSAFISSATCMFRKFSSYYLQYRSSFSPLVQMPTWVLLPLHGGRALTKEPG